MNKKKEIIPYIQEIDFKSSLALKNWIMGWIKIKGYLIFNQTNLRDYYINNLFNDILL